MGRIFIEYWSNFGQVLAEFGGQKSCTFFVGTNGAKLELCKMCLCGYKAREKFAPTELQIHTIFRSNCCPVILLFQTHLSEL